MLGSLRLPLGNRQAKFPLLLFSQELLALLNAGLSLMEALQTLAVKETRPDARKVLEQVIAGLYEGRNLSAALERFPAAFPALYVATVRASERSSGLPEALSRYIDYQSQLDLVRKKLISASIYPVLLISVGLLVTLFLMIYVVPKFSKIYQDVGTELPLLSRLLVQWGNLLEANGLLLAIAAAAIAGAGIYWLRRPAAARPSGPAWRRCAEHQRGPSSFPRHGSQRTDDAGGATDASGRRTDRQDGRNDG